MNFKPDRGKLQQESSSDSQKPPPGNEWQEVFARNKAKKVKNRTISDPSQTLLRDVCTDIIPREGPESNSGALVQGWATWGARVGKTFFLTVTTCGHRLRHFARIPALRQA